MIDTMFQITLSIAISMAVAIVLAKVIVECADLLHLAYDPKKEARRHRDDAHEPLPAPRIKTSPYRLDMTDPVVLRLVQAPANHPTPLADRLRRQRIRRLEAVAGR